MVPLNEMTCMPMALHAFRISTAAAPDAPRTALRPPLKTGSDGSLVIVTTATDIFAPTLRVWASFMDPYECIVVYPDEDSLVGIRAGSLLPVPTPPGGPSSRLG
jgi:hypothetical protein